ncbi:MAG: MFS transporter [Candidatus Cloacimonadaceae bacterium]|nr:MFS transporter [Candidatus Cloacimonadaceae bacterium]
MKRLKHLFVSLQVRNYRLFFMGQGVSLIGTWMQRMTMGWFVYRLTDSAFLLGWVSFLSMIPSVAISPFAGAWADRWNRHHTMIFTQIAFFVQASILSVAVLTGYINAGRLWPLYALSLMLGIIEAVDAPIRQSFVIDLVSKRSLLPNAIATNSAMFNGARLIGPMVGGALIVAFGEGICFSINALSYLPVIGTLLMIRIVYPKVQISKESTISKIVAGWKYSYRNFPIRYLIMNLGIFTLFGMSYATLMPVFARDALHGTARTQGLLMSAAGIGALSGSFYLASRKTIKGLTQTMIIMASLVSIALTVFSFSTSIYHSMILMLVIGLGMMMQMASTNTLIQSIVDDEMRGRVLSIYTMAFMSMSPFGSLLVGSLSSKFGARVTLIISAGICLLWSIIGLRLVPQIVRDIFRMLINNKNTEIYRPRPVILSVNPAER